MTVTLYTAYHKPAPRIESQNIIPIHVGRAAASAPLAGMIGDDTGDSISDRNSTWCELTALYWAWKNDTTSDAIGLMHYRRLLDVTDSAGGHETEMPQASLDSGDWTAETEAWLAQEAGNWDIVLPRMHRMGRTVEDNYRAAHQGQDYDLVRQIITRDHPEYLDAFEKVSAGYDIRLGNIALMSRPIFDRYCAWMFDILFQVEAADLPRGHYSVQQRRYLGFLSERLLTVFVHHLQATQPGLRVREVAILNLANAVILPWLSDHDRPDPDTVNIAFSADRAYLPHAAAMLRSLFDHADPTRRLDLYFLYSDMRPRDLMLLQSLVDSHPTARLTAVDTGGWFDDSYRSASRAPSNATYNRFLLFRLLPALDRLVYLDVDVILKADVCKLYDTDLGGAHLGAVPDWIMTRTLTGPTKTIDPEVPDLADYHRDVLGLTDAQIARYFNAGVLVFDFAAIGDLRALSDRMMEEARTHRYLFRDQDILNRTFKDNLHVLDPRWNVFNSDPAAYDRVPADNHARAMAARRDPWLIHYADRSYKPWNRQAVPLAGLYWQALIRTPFYTEVVGRVRPQKPGRTRNNSVIVATGRAMAERMPLLKGPLLRFYVWLRKHLADV